MDHHLYPNQSSNILCTCCLETLQLTCRCTLSFAAASKGLCAIHPAALTQWWLKALPFTSTSDRSSSYARYPHRLVLTIVMTFIVVMIIILIMTRATIIVVVVVVVVVAVVAAAGVVLRRMPIRCISMLIMAGMAVALSSSCSYHKSSFRLCFLSSELDRCELVLIIIRRTIIYDEGCLRYVLHPDLLTPFSCM